MRKTLDRPRRGSARKVTILQKRIAAITQLRLAHIQQLQSDIMELHRQLSKESAQLRKELLKGALVESGPIRAFFRRKGGKKKMVVK